jgi:hypothetical protein
MPYKKQKKFLVQLWDNRPFALSYDYNNKEVQVSGYTSETKDMLSLLYFIDSEKIRYEKRRGKNKIRFIISCSKKRFFSKLMKLLKDDKWVIVPVQKFGRIVS